MLHGYLLLYMPVYAPRRGKTPAVFDDEAVSVRACSSPAEALCWQQSLSFRSFCVDTGVKLSYHALVRVNKRGQNPAKH